MGESVIIGDVTDADRGALSVAIDADEQARAIVRAVLDGDPDAFRSLVEREGRPVVRLCYRILGDIHEAEDAAQEAFVTAYRALATWRGDGPFGGWLATIATRIAVRRAARRRTVVRLDAAPGDPSSADAVLARATGPTPAPAGPDPVVRVLAAERSEAVRRAVTRLDEPYREVVALRFFGERSLAEIAQESGRPIGTVKTHLHRGMQRLRTLLAQEGLEA